MTSSAIRRHNRHGDWSPVPVRVGTIPVLTVGDSGTGRCASKMALLPPRVWRRRDRPTGWIDRGATVTGTGSKWTVGGNLPIGSLGTGTLTIADSGTVNVGGGAGQVSNQTSCPTLNIGEGGVAGVLASGDPREQWRLELRSHRCGDDQRSRSPATVKSPKSMGAGDTTLANVSAFTGSYSVQGGPDDSPGQRQRKRLPCGRQRNAALLRRHRQSRIANHSQPLPAARSSTMAPTFRGRLSSRSRHAHDPSRRGATTFNGVTTFNSTNIVQNGSCIARQFHQRRHVHQQCPAHVQRGSQRHYRSDQRQ